MMQNRISPGRPSGLRWKGSLVGGLIGTRDGGRGCRWKGCRWERVLLPELYLAEETELFEEPLHTSVDFYSVPLLITHLISNDFITYRLEVSHYNDF